MTVRTMATHLIASYAEPSCYDPAVYVKFTVPEGSDFEPADSSSVTVAVQSEPWDATTGVAHTTEVEVWRRFTVMFADPLESACTPATDPS